MVQTVHLGVLKNLQMKRSEWIEKYKSFEDFGYDSNEIGKELDEYEDRVCRKVFK